MSEPNLVFRASPEITAASRYAKIRQCVARHDPFHKDSSNSSAYVKAVSPCVGFLQIIPFAINPARVGPSEPDSSFKVNRDVPRPMRPRT